MSKKLTNIAVDLTPILPGGENGGAKIFVIELLRQLAEIAPKTNFILLTQANSHEELALLDRSNVWRMMVMGPMAKNSPRSIFKGLAHRALPYLPSRFRRVISLLGYRLFGLIKRSGTGRMLRDMDVDLLFCPFTAPTYVELGIPTVCTIYDLQYKSYPEFFSSADVASRENTFVEACRRSTVLTSISNYSRDTAIAYGNLDPNCIRTIYLRMAQRIVPDTNNNNKVLRRFGLFPRNYLIYPANFWKHKNHEMLLTAFAMACHEDLPTNIKLICTGSPGERQEWLKRAVLNMNLGDRVIFPGYLPAEELAALVANCSGVVFPSLYEGFGLPVIEAMAAGVPVACSNETSLPEVSAGAAILFDPRVPIQIAKSLTSLVMDDSLRTKLIESGLRRAAEFSDASRMAREYWELFYYAINDIRHGNLLDGVYSDGWVGRQLEIQVAAGINKQNLEVEFSIPEWLPHQTVTFQVEYDGQTQDYQHIVKSGSEKLLSIDCGSVEKKIKLTINPIFIPALSLSRSNDQRELSLLLKRCTIVANNTYNIELFPENNHS